MNIQNKTTKDFSSNEELVQIEIINNLLKQYNTTLELNFIGKKYQKIILEGIEICNLMLKIISTKENWQKNKSSSIIRHCLHLDVIPPKYKNVLLKIEKIENKIHDKEKTDVNTALTFLKSFEEFISWFNARYADKYPAIGLYIVKCCKIIDSLPTDKLIADKHKGLIIKTKNQNDEKDLIRNINATLKNLEKHIELISEDNHIGPVLEGYKLSYLMAELFLKKEGYDVADEYVIQDNERIHIFSFFNQNNLLPQECREFLYVIEKYKKEFNDYRSSYESTLIFLETLSYFTIWFDSFYSKKYNVKKPFKIEKFYIAVSSLINPQKDKKKLPVKKQKALFYSGGNPTLFTTPNLLINPNENVILNLMSRKMEYICKKVEDIDNKADRAISKLDDIKEEIMKLSIQITNYQSLLEKQIQNAESENERDRIIAAFVDECSERIAERFNASNLDQTYNMEKDNLIKNLGDETWKKLSENSKTFLVSSKLMYNNFKDMSEIMDYSGVCILVTKALEVEMNKRFFTDFLNYLYANYREKYSKYPTGLLYNGRPMKQEKFNLGSVSYVLCINHGNIKKDQKIKNKKVLIRYCQEELFKTNDENEIKEKINEFGNDIEKIKDKYRNPSAHRDKIKKIDAKECFDIVLDVEKLLKRMLDSFQK